jgi:hypothetical protein
MRGAITSAWLFGMGLISYRYIARQHQPPVPGALLSASGLFALLALMAEWQSAATAAAMLAWGFDLAALLNVLPEAVAGPKAPAPSAPSAPSGGGGGAPRAV